MKTPICALLLAVSSLTGCATGGGNWSKPGSTQNEFYGDLNQCQQQAAQSFPTMMVQRQTSPGFQGAPRPTQTNCRAVGGGQVSCTSSQTGLDASIYNQAPTFVNEDANAGNRSNAVRSCLMARGYRQG